jgi:hypothetical protein
MSESLEIVSSSSVESDRQWLWLTDPSRDILAAIETKEHPWLKLSSG